MPSTNQAKPHSPACLSSTGSAHLTARESSRYITDSDPFKSVRMVDAPPHVDVATLLGSPVRRLLVDTPHDPGIDDDRQLGEIVGLHVTTVRFHLDQLRAGGPAHLLLPAQRRGRPPQRCMPRRPDRWPPTSRQLEGTAMLAELLAEVAPVRTASHPRRTRPGAVGPSSTCREPRTSRPDAGPLDGQGRRDGRRPGPVGYTPRSR